MPVAHPAITGPLRIDIRKLDLGHDASHGLGSDDGTASGVLGNTKTDPSGVCLMAATPSPAFFSTLKVCTRENRRRLAS